MVILQRLSGVFLPVVAVTYDVLHTGRTVRKAHSGEYRMADLIDTTEMYLKTVLELEEEGIVPLRARIADRLGHSGPTVSQTVSRMERDGLLVVSGDRHLELTQLGRERATRVMRKHRLAERLLADVIGLDWPHVHEEACRWEHVMSDSVEQRLVTLLGRPTTSPYGNPIPGTEALGLPPAVPFRDGVISVLEVIGSEAEPHVGRVIQRLAEPVQLVPATLEQFEETGVIPGASVDLAAEGDTVRITAVGFDPLEMPRTLAAHVYVARATPPQD